MPFEFEIHGGNPRSDADECFQRCLHQTCRCIVWSVHMRVHIVLYLRPRRCNYISRCTSRACIHILRTTCCVSLHACIAHKRLVGYGSVFAVIAPHASVGALVSALRVFSSIFFDFCSSETLEWRVGQKSPKNAEGVRSL